MLRADERGVSISVITLNKGRRARTSRACSKASGAAPRPTRCIVVEMGGDDAPLPRPPLPGRARAVPTDGLPLAAARNAGRRAAPGDTLVFLDVDCIPSAGLVAGLSRRGGRA